MGSSLFKYRTLIPSIFSASLTALFAYEPTINLWLSNHSTQVTAYFTCLSFLLSMALVTRMGKSIERYREGITHLVMLQSKLLESIMLINAFLTPGAGEESENNFLKETVIRWCRGFFVLALEEIQGVEGQKLGTLEDEELDYLSNHERKASRLMNWIIYTTFQNRQRFACGDPVFAGLQAHLLSAHDAYVKGLALAETPFPFPVAQLCIFGIFMFAILSPFQCGASFGGNESLVVFSISSKSSEKKQFENAWSAYEKDQLEQENPNDIKLSSQISVIKLENYDPNYSFWKDDNYLKAPNDAARLAWIILETCPVDNVLSQEILKDCILDLKQKNDVSSLAMLAARAEIKQTVFPMSEEDRRRYQRAYSDQLQRGGEFLRRCELEKTGKKEWIPGSMNHTWLLQPEKKKLLCSLCRITVDSIFTFCSKCSHGGHGKCLSKWFASQQACATGCGCACLSSTS